VALRSARPRSRASGGALRVRVHARDVQAGREAPVGLFRAADPARGPARRQARRRRRPQGLRTAGECDPRGRALQPLRGGICREGDRRPGRVARAQRRPMSSGTRRGLSFDDPRRKDERMQKITTWLWFDTEAEEAAEFYTSIFPDARITEISRYGEAGPRPEGMVMTVGFELFGREFFALNGGSNHKIEG